MSIHSIFGSKRYEFPKEYAASVTNACISASIECEAHSFSEKSFFCSVPYFLSARAEACFDSLRIPYREASIGGIIPFLIRYKRRSGIFIGALLLLCITMASSSFLWNIEITGNEIIKESELTEVLKLSGLYLGCYLPDTDIDSVESAALVNDKRMSWISVNISGNTAYVEIRERINASLEERVLPYANIVASEDAIITEMQIFSGMASVKADAYVREGDLLISGVISKEAIGTHLTYARGKVYGKNFKEIEIEIPFVYSVLQETGNKKYGVNFHFFEKRFSFLPFGNIYENFSEYLTVYNIKEGNRSLPIYFERIEYRESDYTVKLRGEDEAKDEARREFDAFLEKELSDAEILSVESEYMVTENSLILKCEVWYEREIGRTVEFEGE